jgi:LuxR family maltose regulon positive regulatory protein
MNDRMTNKKTAIFTENRTYLERPRINRIFADAIRKPLVIVSAGAGYGKTSAVYSFLKDYDATKKWFQISEHDNFGPRFWEKFANIISHHSKQIAERLFNIGFPETESQFANYISIIEDEISQREKIVMVFDDFHMIHERSVLQFIERSIKSPFSNITTVLISRTDPNINTVKLLSQGLVASVNENDLRLTEGEIAQYFKLLGTPLSPQSVSNIYADTVGWMFAVNLISLSLKKSPVHEQRARIAMKLNIFKMIEDEVFAVISGRLQRFLIKLSLIDHLSSELVSILAGDDGALVDELRKISSFVRHDIYLHAYLIHHLFLDYLRQRQNLLTEEDRKDVYLKAALWCDENDYKMDAIAYYEKAGEYKSIVEIVHLFPVQFPCDQAKFILDVYDKAPPDVLDSFVQYHIQRPNLLMSLSLYEEAIDDVKKRIEKYSALPSSDFNSRVLCGAHLALGLAYYLMAPRADRYDFDAPIRKAYHYYSLSPYQEPDSLSGMKLSAIVSKVGTTRSGAMEEFIGALTRSIPHVANILNGCMYGMDDLAMGELQFYKGSLKNAVKFLKQAFNKAEERGQYEVRNRALFYLLRIAVAQGDYEEIQNVHRDLKAQIEMKKYHFRFLTFDIISSWFYSALGQPALIPHWILNGEFSKGSIGTFKADFGNFVKAKFYYSDKRYHELLSFVESEPTFSDVLFGKIEVKLLTSVCQYKLRNRDASMIALREAYDLAESNNLTMQFIEFGRDMRTLTRAAAQDKGCGIPSQWLKLINRKSATYAKRLLYIISEYKKSHDMVSDTPLSAREEEILKDLCNGLSRSEIAANHDLSVNTVKMVLNAIYSKLGAENLTDVVKIAMNRNLIK